MTSDDHRPEDCQPGQDGQSAREAEEALSPALLASGGAAYELKFLLSTPHAIDVEAWARKNLRLDPYANPALGDAYRIFSLYLDTPQHDIFHGTPKFKKRKFRLRRYGSDGFLFLERKTKSGDRVRKRRSRVPMDDVGHLESPFLGDTWPGEWFRRRIQQRNLRPVCQVAYDRLAFQSNGAERSMRLTLDRQVQCAPSAAWNVGDFLHVQPLLTNHVILELKYHTAMPALFKQLMHELSLAPCPVSKYKLSVQAWGLAAPPREVG